MKHAFALLLLSCALVGEDNPPTNIQQQSISADMIPQDGSAISKAVKIRLLAGRFNSLAESIKLNEAAAKMFWTARATKGLLDFSTLALEQRKLWTQTLSEITDLSK